MKSHSLFCFNGVISLTCSPFIAYAFLYRWELRFINGALRFVDKPGWAFSMNLISFMFLVCAILAIFIYKKEENGRKKKLFISLSGIYHRFRTVSLNFFCNFCIHFGNIVYR